MKSMQCPKCGSPLARDTSGRVEVCDFCGAALRAIGGASGHPVVVLEDNAPPETPLFLRCRWAGRARCITRRDLDPPDFEDCVLYTPWEAIRSDERQYWFAEDGLVSDAGVCPVCREERTDLLVVDGEGRIVCQSCGTRYYPRDPN